MSFKSDKQRKAVMVILRQLRRGKTVYHVSKEGLRGFGPGDVLHVGTRDAALQRAIDLGEGHDYPVYRMKLQSTKPLLTHGRFFDESEPLQRPRRRGFTDYESHRLDRALGQGDWLGWYGSRKIVGRLKRRGFDTVPYRNMNEDLGSLSYAVLDPGAITDIKLLGPAAKLLRKKMRKMR
jgi:hypothetical protein